MRYCKRISEYYENNVRYVCSVNTDLVLNKIKLKRQHTSNSRIVYVMIFYTLLSSICKYKYANIQQILYNTLLLYFGFLFI